MSIDKSVITPGPMGWGVENEDINDTKYKEKTSFAHLQENKPERLVRRAARAPNITLFAELQKLMQEDGIEGGFSCRHVEKLIFGDFLSWISQKIGSCFEAGTMVRMADGSEKPIEDIKVGDRVISHTGTARRVTNTFVRKYTGDMYTTSVFGHPFTVTMTADHKMGTVPWVGSRFDLRTAELDNIEWVRSENLTIDNRFIVAKQELCQEPIHRVLDLYSILHNDVILCDNGSKVKNASGIGKKVNRFISVTPSLMRLLGLYAAEGGTDKCRVTFTFNISESNTLADEVCSLIKGIFNVTAVKIEEPNNTRCTVRANCRILEKFFKYAVPGNVYTKRAPWFLWQSGFSGRMAFLCGWLDGDGCYHKGKKNKRITGVTASRNLASDIHTLAMSCNLIVSGRKRKAYKQSKEAYDIEFAGNAVDMITKPSTYANLKTCKRHKYGIVRKITEIVKNYVVDLPVYDIEVEEDHSFIANGLISSNCVASGSMRAIARRTLIESFLLSEPEEIFGTTLVGVNNVAPFAPYHYRAGRKKGGLNGNMDGSFCGAQIEGLFDFGILPCSAQGLVSDAFPEPQNTRTYKQWGANDTLLNKFATIGRTYKLLESEQIKNYEDHWTALNDHYKPQMVCSDWAFKPKAEHPTWKLENGDPVWIYTRDRRASWAHNMTLDGVLIHRGNKFTCVDNSWGENAHRNGSFFIIEAEEMEKWIKDAEIMTIGDIDMKDNISPA